MGSNKDQKVEEHKQLLGSDLLYSFDFSEWLDDQGLTGSTAGATVVDGTSVTVANENFASGVWSGVVTAASTGFSTIEVVLTPASGAQRRHRRFCVEVTDPSCS